MIDFFSVWKSYVNQMSSEVYVKVPKNQRSLDIPKGDSLESTKIKKIKASKESHFWALKLK